ncbi:hypothetical protein SUDANB1_05591 [Streptomyces sp. enrichment culture]|uniref:helix-turn-helix domain-containing protein n=1 Tax=Streptomyces sp. enrichment culture TaxID=1795815 RepID=UPI003F5711A6
MTTVDIAALYDEGMSVRGVAGRIGRSYSTARKHLLAAGVEMRPTGSTIASETLELAKEAAELYGQDLTVRAVAERLGYSHSYVHHLLDLAEVEMRPSWYRSPRTVR